MNSSLNLENKLIMYNEENSISDPVDGSMFESANDGPAVSLWCQRDVGPS